VIFAGRSNVGKSSCINTLVGIHDAARVSRAPGRTRALNLFEIPERYVLVDLPGYGYAQVSREMHKGWEDLVERYLEGRASLRGAVLLLDPRREPDVLDLMLLDSLGAREVPVVLVATKVDKLSRNELRKALAGLRQVLGLGEDEIVPFSSHDRIGVAELQAVIDELVRVSPPPSQDGPGRRSRGGANPSG